MDEKLVIAIDGHSSCGKSTLAKGLSAALGFRHIDSGAMYRAVTHSFITHGISLEDIEAVSQRLSEMELKFVVGESLTELVLDGKRVDQELRSQIVTSTVSKVAKISIVRSKLVEMQRGLGNEGGIVMDGRDIGSVVFPGAGLKIFLTASIDVRSDRRYTEMINMGYQVTLDEVKENLIQRDRLDSTRANSPLVQTSDAVLVDNTNLSEKEQLAMIVTLANLRRT